MGGVSDDYFPWRKTTCAILIVIYPRFSARKENVRKWRTQSPFIFNMSAWRPLSLWIMHIVAPQSRNLWKVERLSEWIFSLGIPTIFRGLSTEKQQWIYSRPCCRNNVVLTRSVASGGYLVAGVTGGYC